MFNFCYTRTFAFSEPYGSWSGELSSRSRSRLSSSPFSIFDAGCPLGQSPPASPAPSTNISLHQWLQLRRSPLLPTRRVHFPLRSLPTRSLPLRCPRHSRLFLPLQHFLERTLQWRPLWRRTSSSGVKTSLQLWYPGSERGPGGRRIVWGVAACCWGRLVWSDAASGGG